MTLKQLPKPKQGKAKIQKERIQERMAEKKRKIQKKEKVLFIYIITQKEKALMEN